MTLLKEKEQRYGQSNEYNTFTENPFKQYKKHFIAADMKAGHFVESTDGSPFSFTYKFVNVSGNITCYQDVVIGRKEKNDVVIDHLWGNLDKMASMYPEFFSAERRRFPVWVYSWREDTRKHDWLIAQGFKQQYAKIDTFGSILGIYFADGGARLDDRTLPTLSVLETTPIIDCGHFCLGGKERHVPRVEETLKLLDHINFENHYSNYNRGKAWSAVSLRGYEENPLGIEKPAEMSKKWKAEHPGWETWKIQDTGLRRLFPFVDEMLDFAFRNLEIHRIRFMKLSPGGGELQRHTDQVDPDVGATPGKLGRFHFPFKTNKDVLFSAWDFNGVKNTYNMQTERLYYLDTRKPHTAINNGTEERIHLVVDVVLDDQLIETLEKMHDKFGRH